MSNEIFPKKPWKYSFDTSAFIDSYKRYYPMDIFPKLWKFLERIINNQIIVVSIMVDKEINYENDDLTSFINKFSNLFISPDKNMQHYVKILINNDKFRM